MPGRRMTQPRFANARNVLNALARARLRHANWLIAAEGTFGKDYLMRLEPADFLASRVFGAWSISNRVPRQNAESHMPDMVKRSIQSWT